MGVNPNLGLIPNVIPLPILARLSFILCFGHILLFSWNDLSRILKIKEVRKVDTCISMSKSGLGVTFKCRFLCKTKSDLLNFFLMDFVIFLPEFRYGDMKRGHVAALTLCPFLPKASVAGTSEFCYRSS